MKESEKRLVFEIDRGLHLSIRLAAIKSQMTIKQWVITAIAKALLEESNKNTEI